MADAHIGAPLYFRLAGFEVAERFLDMVVEDAAVFCQCDAFGIADKQLRLQFFLQCADGFADCRLADIKAARRTGDTAGFADSRKDMVEGNVDVHFGSFQKYNQKL